MKFILEYKVFVNDNILRDKIIDIFSKVGKERYNIKDIKKIVDSKSFKTLDDKVKEILNRYFNIYNRDKNLEFKYIIEELNRYFPKALDRQMDNIIDDIGDDIDVRFFNIEDEEDIKFLAKDIEKYINNFLLFIYIDNNDIWVERLNLLKVNDKFVDYFIDYVLEELDMKHIDKINSENYKALIKIFNIDNGYIKFKSEGIFYKKIAENVFRYIVKSIDKKLIENLDEIIKQNNFIVPYFKDVLTPEQIKKYDHILNADDFGFLDN